MEEPRRQIDRLSYQNTLTIIEHIEKLQDDLKAFDNKLIGMNTRLSELEVSVGKDKSFIFGVVFCFTSIIGIILTLATHIKELFQ